MTTKSVSGYFSGYIPDFDNVNNFIRSQINVEKSYVFYVDKGEGKTLPACKVKKPKIEKYHLGKTCDAISRVIGERGTNCIGRRRKTYDCKGCQSF